MTVLKSCLKAIVCPINFSLNSLYLIVLSVFSSFLNRTSSSHRMITLQVACSTRLFIYPNTSSISKQHLSKSSKTIIFLPMILSLGFNKISKISFPFIISFKSLLSPSLLISTTPFVTTLKVPAITFFAN